MELRSITAAALEAFEAALLREEKGRSTREYYLRAARRLTAWLDGRALSKEAAIAYREELERQGYRTASINTIIAALNSFFRCIGREDCRLKSLRCQRRSFDAEDKVLSREDYVKLVRAAQARRNTRLTLLLETLCATGIRVSELPFITVEAARAGRALVRLKGKTRPVLISRPLRRQLLRYARVRGVEAGPIFITRTGRPMDRSNIWRAMKGLCASAGVDPKKVFPHNLRHLFARIFYSLRKDIALLADLLGHSSINTTRLYLIHSWEEQQALLDSMELVLIDLPLVIKKHRPRAALRR